MRARCVKMAVYSSPRDKITAQSPLARRPKVAASGVALMVGSACTGGLNSLIRPWCFYGGKRWSMKHRVQRQSLGVSKGGGVRFSSQRNVPRWQLQ